MVSSNVRHSMLIMLTERKVLIIVLLGIAIVAFSIPSGFAYNKEMVG
jgi:hypothetical protein